MTTDELLAILSVRGLRVVIRDGQPALRGKAENVTPTLLRALAFHRDALAARGESLPDLPPRSEPIAEPGNQSQGGDMPEPLGYFCPWCEQEHSDVPWWGAVCDPLTDPVKVDARGLHCLCKRCWQ